MAWAWVCMALGATGAQAQDVSAAEAARAKLRDQGKNYRVSLAKEQKAREDAQRDLLECKASLQACQQPAKRSFATPPPGAPR